MGRKAEYYYMIVTADEFELPIYVADSAKELADYLCITESTVRTAIFRKRNGVINGYRLAKVAKKEEVEESGQERNI